MGVGNRVREWHTSDDGSSAEGKRGNSIWEGSTGSTDCVCNVLSYTILSFYCTAKKNLKFNYAVLAKYFKVWATCVLKDEKKQRLKFTKMILSLWLWIVLIFLFLVFYIF